MSLYPSCTRSWGAYSFFNKRRAFSFQDILSTAVTVILYLIYRCSCFAYVTFLSGAACSQLNSFFLWTYPISRSVMAHGRMHKWFGCYLGLYFFPSCMAAPFFPLHGVFFLWPEKVQINFFEVWFYVVVFSSIIIPINTLGVRYWTVSFYPRKSRIFNIVLIHYWKIKLIEGTFNNEITTTPKNGN